MRRPQSKGSSVLCWAGTAVKSPLETSSPIASIGLLVVDTQRTGQTLGTLSSPGCGPTSQTSREEQVRSSRLSEVALTATDSSIDQCSQPVPFACQCQLFLLQLL